MHICASARLTVVTDSPTAVQTKNISVLRLLKLGVGARQQPPGSLQNRAEEELEITIRRQLLPCPGENRP
jgi:hypothetical protein